MIAGKQKLVLRQGERIVEPPPVSPKSPEPVERAYALLIAFRALTDGHPAEAAR